MHEKRDRKFIKKEQREPDTNSLAEKVLSGDRISLSRAITYIESHAPRHQQTAQEILKLLLPHAGKSVRIGITGVPGAGKSTFIETFGLMLCNKGHRVAVLAIDPSSTVHGGSILGDKTRMERLSSHPHAFIRPSPSGGKLGGVHRKTRESIIACEAAGYDVILVETVGVGQSEVIVKGMVDFFMLLVLTGAGDELQGMKKGIMELADAIIVNKADGENVQLAKKTRKEYEQILHFLQPATEGWKTPALTCSALKNQGIDRIWNVVQQFINITKQSGQFEKRRQDQAVNWLHSLIKEELETSFFQHPSVKKLIPAIEAKVSNGEMPAMNAAQTLFSAFKEGR